MWLLKAPKYSIVYQTGRIFEHDFHQGFVLVSKQYWYKFFMDRKFKDVTPRELKEVALSPKRALFVRWGGYGDMLMATPIFRALKKKFPDIKIALAGLDDHVQILRHSRDIDKFLACPSHQIGNLVERHDMAVDLSGIVPSNWEAEVKNAYDIHFEWCGLDPQAYSPKEKRPTIEVRDREIAEATTTFTQVGIEEDDELIIFSGESTTGIRNLSWSKAQDIIMKLAKAFPEKKICCVSNDAIQYRRKICCCKCKFENIIAINGQLKKDIKHTCKKCNRTIMIKSSISKKKYTEQTVKWVEFPKNVFFCKLSIREFALLIKRAVLLVAVDCGLTHIAGAFEIPILGLFSSFVADYRLKYFKHAYWIQQPYKCAPCFLHHIHCPQAVRQKVPFAPCLESIDAEEVVEAARRIIAEDWVYCEKNLKEKRDIDLAKKLKCPICGNGEIAPKCRKGDFMHYLCSNCECLFVHPQPNDTYLANGYNDRSYMHIYKTLTGVKKYARIVTTSFAEEFDHKGKLLEIGVNLGHFLEETQRLGWDCYGVDISEYAAKICKKKGLKNVIAGNIEDDVTFKKILENAPYNLIVVHHTIEHFRDPIKLIRQISSLLSKKGIISIITPDVGAWNGLNTWGHLNTHFAGEHLVLFSNRTLHALSAKCNLRVDQVFHLKDSQDIWVILRNG